MFGVVDRAAVALHRREADVVEHDVDDVRRSSGAFGGSNGAQSGTESRMSTLILPLNGALMVRPRVLARPGRRITPMR